MCLLFVVVQSIEVKSAHNGIGQKSLILEWNVENLHTHTQNSERIRETIGAFNKRVSLH